MRLSITFCVVCTPFVTLCPTPLYITFVWGTVSCSAIPGRAVLCYVKLRVRCCMALCSVATSVCVCERTCGCVHGTTAMAAPPLCRVYRGYHSAAWAELRSWRGRFGYACKK